MKIGDKCNLIWIFRIISSQAMTNFELALYCFHLFDPIVQKKWELALWGRGFERFLFTRISIKRSSAMALYCVLRVRYTSDDWMTLGCRWYMCRTAFVDLSDPIGEPGRAVPISSDVPLDMSTTSITD